MKQELYLKTAFCCMACDGNIADEEIQLIRKYSQQSSVFDGLDIETLLNEYISHINQQGISFLHSYLQEISDTKLSQDDEIQLVEIAIAMIEADNIVEYSEIKFFKKIRQRLNLSDDYILSIIPNNTVTGDKEFYITPDIQESPAIDLNLPPIHFNFEEK